MFCCWRRVQPSARAEICVAVLFPASDSASHPSKPSSPLPPRSWKNAECLSLVKISQLCDATTITQGSCLLGMSSLPCLWFKAVWHEKLELPSGDCVSLPTSCSLSVQTHVGLLYSTRKDLKGVTISTFTSRTTNTSVTTSVSDEMCHMVHMFGVTDWGFGAIHVRVSSWNTRKSFPL